MTSKQSRELIARLNRDGERIAVRFGLSYRCIEAEHANVKRRYGVCYSDGTIRIRLRHAVSGRSLKYSSLVNTLCHELAHLEHFNHGLRFRAFYGRLLEWARAEGIYRPSRSAGAPAVPRGEASQCPDARPDPGGIPILRPAPLEPSSEVRPAAAQTGSGFVGEQLNLFG